MDVKTQAMEFAKSEGFTGKGDYLTRRLGVCGIPAVEVVEFTEGVERVIVTRVVPFGALPALLVAPDLLAKLTKLVADLDSLIADSKGVAGLHRNGDVATWDELTAGGRFEGWLSSLDDARDLLDQLNQTRFRP